MSNRSAFETCGPAFRALEELEGVCSDAYNFAERIDMLWWDVYDSDDDRFLELPKLGPILTAITERKSEIVEKFDAAEAAIRAIAAEIGVDLP